MKKITILIFLLFSSNVFAEWSVVKSVSVSRTDMNIVDFKPFVGSNFKTVRSVSYEAFNLSLTAAQDKIYITANTELPLSNQSYQFRDIGSDVVRTLDREDWGLTVGYNVYKGVNIFSGFSYGANRFLNASVSIPGTVTSVKEIDSGQFLGAAYSYDFKRYGTVSATLAYALLKGDIKSNETSNITTNNKGDTTGFSFSITYSNMFNKDSNYFWTVKIKSYDYDNVASGSQTVNIVKEKNFFLVSGGLDIF